MDPFFWEEFVKQYSESLQETEEENKKMPIPVIASIAGLFKRKPASTRFLSIENEDDNSDLTIVVIAGVLILGAFAFLIFNQNK